MMDGRNAGKNKRRGPLTPLMKMVSALFSNRIFLRIFSLLFAIVVWCVFVASDGTLTRQKTFTGVSLGVNGESALLSRGYIVTDDLADIAPSVTLTTEVTQANFERASASSYNPHLEYGQITGEGEVTLPVVFTSQIYGQVVSCQPASVTLHVERYITRRVPVVVEQEGEMADGLYLLSNELEPATLVVSGPQSQVSSVARATVTLDRSVLSAERMTDRLALGFTLRDAEGEALPMGKMSVTNQGVVIDSVTLEATLLPMVSLPLDTTALTTGEPAEGYELTQAWAQENTLAIAAEQEVLDALSTLAIEEPLDITGATETVTGTVRVRAVTGARNRVPTQVTATAVIRERQIERTFRNVPIQAENAADNVSVTLSQGRTTAQLTGGYAFISGLTVSDLQLVVDVSGLEAGQYKLPVQIRVDNAPPFSCALGSPEITVTIRER